MDWNAIIPYITRIIPAVAVIGLLILFLPKKSIEFRITAYILLFLVTRDAMTPAGLWRFGAEGFFWLRFSENGAALLILGALSAGLAAMILLFDAEARHLIVWWRGARIPAIVSGIAGAFIVFLPFVFLYAGSDLQSRGGMVAAGLIAPIAVMAFAGNFLEETLFRGFFQGIMETHTGSVRAALASGVMFAAGHVFLAVTLTSIGWPILIFTLYEGTVAALVRMRFGLAAATLTHGGAIFLLASGIY